MLDLEEPIPTDAYIEHYHSLQPQRFTSLRRMELCQAETHQTLTLEMEHDTEAVQMLLTFAGVIGFEFNPYNFQPVPLYLEVVYIGARQWEGLNYQVFNTEQDVRLFFYCRDFHAALQDCDRTEQPAE